MRIFAVKSFAARVVGEVHESAAESGQCKILNSGRINDSRYNPNTVCAPYTYIVDRVDDGLFTRLFGTQLVESRGLDLTGKSYVSGQPEDIAHAIVSNVIKLLKQPCGLHAMNAFSSTKGRKFISEVVVLPLGEGQESTQAVGINDIRNTIGFDETVSGWLGVTEISWIDIGLGIPDQDPMSN